MRVEVSMTTEVCNGLAPVHQILLVTCICTNSFAIHSQVQSSGLLQATPHCVRAASGPSAAGVARNAFAVFMQPRCMPLMGLSLGASSSLDRNKHPCLGCLLARL